MTAVIVTFQRDYVRFVASVAECVQSDREWATKHNESLVALEGDDAVKLLEYISGLVRSCPANNQTCAFCLKLSAALATYKAALGAGD